jgi:hypothetical protein
MHPVGWSPWPVMVVGKRKKSIILIVFWYRCLQRPIVYPDAGVILGAG